MFLKVAKIHNVVPLMTPYILVGMYKSSVLSSGQFILWRWKQNIKRNVGTIPPYNRTQNTTQSAIICFILIMSAWIFNEILYHTLMYVCLFSWRYNPLWLYLHSPVTSFSLLVFEVSWSHTTRHSPLDEWSIRRRDLYLTTHNTTNIHAPGGIRTHNLSRRAAKDLRLRPCGHWDGLYHTLIIKVKVNLSHNRPTGFQEVKAPRFLDIGTWRW
jgi:hypothetical protein